MSRRGYGVRVRTGLAGLRHARGTLATGRAGRARNGQSEHDGIESLYAIYPPEKAPVLAERLRIHYTPEHGKRLNFAEIGLSALCGQCLNQRMPTSPP